MAAVEPVGVVDEATPVVLRVRDRLAAAGVAVERYRPGQESGATVLVVGGGSTIPAGFTAGMPRLAVVVRTGAGFDNLPVAELAARGIALVAPRLTADGSVAEFVLGAAIALLRDFRRADRAVRAGDFGFRNGAGRRDLARSVLGVVGMGRIGRRVAELGGAFGMPVIGWNPWSQRPFPHGVRRAGTLATLLSEADVVTLHCRLTDATRHLVDATALGAMRPGAILINTARGGLVDELALAQALREGRLAGAAVDTFAAEPDVAASPLATVPTALLSPHLAGLTDQSVEALSAFVTTTVTDYLATGSLLSLIHI